MRKINILFVSLLVFFIGAYKVDAKECKYVSEKDKTRIIYIRDKGTSSSCEGKGKSINSDKSCLSLEGFNKSGQTYKIVAENITIGTSSCTNELYIVETSDLVVQSNKTVKVYMEKPSSNNYEKFVNSQASSSNTSNSCIASTTNKNTLVCCYKYGDTELKVTVRDGVSSSTGNHYTDLGIIAMGKEASTTQVKKQYYSKDGSDFKNGCPSIIGFTRGSSNNKVYYIYFSSNYKNSSEFNTNKESLIKTYGDRNVVSNTLSLTSSAGSYKAVESSNESRTDSNTSSSDKKCVYVYNNSELTFTIGNSVDFKYTGTDKTTAVVNKKEVLKDSCPNEIKAFYTNYFNSTYKYYLFPNGDMSSDSNYEKVNNVMRSGNTSNIIYYTLSYKLKNSNDSSYSYDDSYSDSYLPFVDTINEITESVKESIFDITSIFGNTRSNSDKTTYEDENISDDPNYKSLVSTKLVYCGSNVLKDTYIDSKGKVHKVYDGLTIRKIPVRLINILNVIIKILYIAVPILLIILGMIDFGKAVMGQKDDEINKGKKIFFKRLITGVLVFIVVVVVKMVVRFINNSTENGYLVDCIDCFISGECHQETK